MAERLAVDPGTLASSLEQAGIACLVTDPELGESAPKILYANPGLAELTGYSRAELIGRRIDLFQPQGPDLAFLAGLRRQLQQGRSFNGHTRIRRRDGSLFLMACTVSPIRDDNGRVTHFFAVIRDLSPPPELGLKPEEGFERRAAADPLTGALTRLHLCRHLEAELQRLRRYGGEASFLLLALDGLHASGEGSPDHHGEGLLREVARVVGERSRAADLLAPWPGACLALLAPETFAEEGGLLAEKLQATLRERLFPHSGHRPVRIGVAILRPGDTLNGVIQRAEAAFNRASGQGSDGIATL